MSTNLLYTALLVFSLFILVIIYFLYKSIQYRQREFDLLVSNFLHDQQVLSIQESTLERDRDQWFCEEHNKYLEQVTESGLPLYLWDQSIPSINPNNQ